MVKRYADLEKAMANFNFILDKLAEKMAEAKEGDLLAALFDEYMAYQGRVAALSGVMGELNALIQEVDDH